MALSCGGLVDMPDGERDANDISRGLPGLQRLPDHMILIRPVAEPGVFAVAAHEDRGAMFWTRVELPDLPQNLTRVEDFIGAILAAADRLAVSQFKNGMRWRKVDYVPFTVRSKCVGLISRIVTSLPCSSAALMAYFYPALCHLSRLHRREPIAKGIASRIGSEGREALGAGIATPCPRLIA
jgi:hypothetical protein